MKNFFLGFFMGLILTAWAGQISAPPPLPESSPVLQHYLHELYRTHNVLEVTTTAPNNNLRGLNGKAILRNNGGTYELWVKDNIDSTSWQRIQ